MSAISTVSTVSTVNTMDAASSGLSGLSGFTVLIPARMASSRLPDKPLADIAGLPMVVRVAQRARASAAARTVVATDDARILAACRQHGVEALMTDAHHPSGSDRLAQACQMLGLGDEAIVVNVQGDEPLIDPALINAVAAALQAQPEAQMATAAHAITERADYENPNVVKVVCNAQGMAQYFSRAAIPFARDAQQSGSDAPWWQSPSAGGFAPLRHIGIYSYRAAFLRQFPRLPPAPTEAVEALEQLRVLWHGYRIAVHITPQAPGPGVDTPEDLQRVRALFALLAANPVAPLLGQ